MQETERAYDAFTFEHCSLCILIHCLLFDTPTKRQSSKDQAAKDPATKGPLTKGSDRKGPDSGFL